MSECEITRTVRMALDRCDADGVTEVSKRLHAVYEDLYNAGQQVKGEAPDVSKRLFRQAANQIWRVDKPIEPARPRCGCCHCAAVQ